MIFVINCCVTFYTETVPAKATGSMFKNIFSECTNTKGDNFFCRLQESNPGPLKYEPIMQTSRPTQRLHLRGTLLSNCSQLRFEKEEDFSFSSEKLLLQLLVANRLCQIDQLGPFVPHLQTAKERKS